MLNQATTSARHSKACRERGKQKKALYREANINGERRLIPEKERLYKFDATSLNNERASGNPMHVHCLYLISKIIQLRSPPQELGNQRCRSQRGYYTKRTSS